MLQLASHYIYLFVPFLFALCVFCCNTSIWEHLGLLGSIWVYLGAWVHFRYQFFLTELCTFRKLCSFIVFLCTGIPLEGLLSNGLARSCLADEISQTMASHIYLGVSLLDTPIHKRSSCILEGAAEDCMFQDVLALECTSWRVQTALSSRERGRMELLVLSMHMFD